MRPFLTTKQFIDKAILVHGNKYCYDLVVYERTNKKVKIKCLIHNDYFMQEPAMHLLGHGCPWCSGRYKTTEQYIIEAKQIHGTMFNYDDTKYIDSTTPIICKCSKNGHIVKQPPGKHLLAKDCPYCLGKNKSIEEFIEMSKIIHGEKYDYSFVKTTKHNKRIKLICKIHGKFFTTPNLHLKHNQGCPKCSRYQGKFTKNTKDFVKYSRIIHGNKYSYKLVNYVSKYEKVLITCKKHGNFLQRPCNHYRGKGCPECAKDRRRSKNEKHCFKKLKKMFPQFIFASSDRKLLKNKGPKGGNLEIDIIVKDKFKNNLLFIEWNGIHWHSDEEAKLNDKIKKDILGDKLLVIEDPGAHKKSFVETVIRTIIKPVFDKLEKGL